MKKISLLFSFLAIIAFSTIVTTSPQSFAQDFEEDEFDEEDFDTVDDSGDEDFVEDDFAEDDSGDEDFADVDFGDDEEDDSSLEEFEDDGEEEVAEGEENEEEQLLEPLDESEENQFVEEEIPADSVPEEEQIVEDSMPEEEQIAEDTPEPMQEALPADDSFVQISGGQSGPDLEYESRLFDIYVNFHSKQTAEDEWQALLGDRVNEAYEIQPGDTLWAISETLFGDGNYWPKVWSLNGKITNPHLIKEGNSIGFILGDESEAPSFTVSETPEDPAGEVITEEAVEEDLETEEASFEEENSQVVVTNGETIMVGGEEIELPPPGIVSRPVLHNLPPSLPIWHKGGEDSGYDELGMEFVRRPILDLKDRFPLLGYLSEQVPTGVGEIVEVEGGSKVATVSQYIYVKVKAGSVSQGDTYGVVYNHGELERSHETIDNDLPAYNIQVQGEVELTQKVENDGDSEFEIYRGLVKKAINPILVGGVLVEEKPTQVFPNENGPKNDVVAQVIGGNFTNKSQLFGPQTILFLNRGAKDGIEKGQVLAVIANRKVRNPDSEVTQNVKPIGWIQVVRTTENFTTAFVLKTWDDINAGDLTGRGLFSDIKGSLKGRQSEDLDDMDFDDEGSAEEDFGDDELDGPETAEAELIEGEDDVEPLDDEGFEDEDLDSEIEDEF